MFECITKHFKKKKKPTRYKKPAPDTENIDEQDEIDIIDEIERRAKNKRVAFIRGHSKKKQGADTYPLPTGKFKDGKEILKKISEWIWTSIQNQRIIFYLISWIGKEFDRSGIYIRGVLKLLMKFKPYIVIDHHFNSIGHSKAAFGKEILMLEKYKGTYAEEQARRLIAMIDAEFPGRLRHDKGIKWIKEYVKGEDNDRGAYNLTEWDKCGAELVFLTEFFFGGYRTKESAQFLEDDGPERYCKVIAEFIEGL